MRSSAWRVKGVPNAQLGKEKKTMTDFSFGRKLIDQLDRWANELASPLLPPREVFEEGNEIRLEFREHIPHSVLIGKSIRAVSGIRAALVLADLGYLAECAALLRVVSDFCTEITAVGEALNRGGKFPAAVQKFVDQYFIQKPRTPEDLAETERTRYVSREELMKADLRLAENAQIDGEQMRIVRRFLNMTYDAYIHGSYETTMELYDPLTGRFMMSGNASASKREEFVEAVLLKLHEVIVAIEFTAAVTANASIFNAAREARHTMDAIEPWKNS
ncbi:MAG: hypothetical protein NTY36_13960 [Deltaproteobacteria bacterium]|nr:hypothetical protein [Deltaproteobacteria bacterium]